MSRKKIDERKARRLINQALERDGWNLPKLRETSFICKETPSMDSYSKIIFSSRYKLIDIFLYYFPSSLLKTIVERRIQDDNKAFMFSAGRNLKVSNHKIYKYIAMYIRIQGEQNSPKENQQNIKAQRKSFAKQKEYYDKKYPASKTPGLSAIEILHNQIYIGISEMDDINKILLDSVSLIGQWAAGEEKLFYYCEDAR